jgi:hypothetical protein
MVDDAFGLAMEDGADLEVALEVSASKRSMIPGSPN